MGVAQHPLYGTWRSILARCNNPHVHNFRNYGGRGIAVCERWKTFANFVADVGEKPGSAYTLDRANPDGDYTPENCLWATKTRQARNQRRTTTVIIDGITHTAPDLAERAGLHTKTIISRIRRGLRTMQELTAPAWSSRTPGPPSAKTVARWEAIRSRTHCKRGHEYTEGTSFIDRSGSRVCRTCINEARRVARKAAKVCS